MAPSILDEIAAREIVQRLLGCDPWRILLLALRDDPGLWTQGRGREGRVKRINVAKLARAMRDRGTPVTRARAQRMLATLQSLIDGTIPWQAAIAA
jgi:hypothetical protein